MKKTEPPYGLFLKGTYIKPWRLLALRATWEIRDSSGKKVDTLEGAFSWQAQKCLKWWCRWGELGSEHKVK